MEDAVVVELNDIIMQNYSQPPSYFYNILFEYIMENKQLCHMLFGSNGKGSFIGRLNILFEEKCLETWCKEWNHSEISEELKYNIRYHVQGCLAIISRWVESNFTYPMDELVKIIADIDRNTEYYFMKKQKKA